MNNSNVNKSEREIKNIYEAPLIIVLFLLIIFFIWGNLVCLKIAFALGFVSLLSKKVASIIGLVWKNILKAVGFVNAHILLTAVFFIVLTPMAFLYRLFKKDPLKLKGGKASYYIERNHDFVASDMENPW